MSTDPAHLGKFGEDELEKYVFPHLETSGGRRADLRYGSDYNTVDLDKGRVMVLSTDPLALSPGMGWARSAQLALQVITTDVAVSGVSPSHLLANWNLPPGMENETFAEAWQGFTGEAREVGLEIVGGHTGRYQGQDFPIVGAGTAFGIGDKSELLSGKLKPGDRIFCLNELGLEAAAIFSFYYPEKMAELTSQELINRLRGKFDRLSPTKTLSQMADLPDIRVLHDIAEGGLIGGLQELLAGSELGASVSVSKLEIDPDVERACNRLDLDPIRVTSIGSGIATVDPARKESFMEQAAKANLEVQEVGRVTNSGPIELERSAGSEKITEPVRDAFWKRLAEFGPNPGPRDLTDSSWPSSPSRLKPDQS